MIEAIIFDLDGTLVDSEMLFVRALQGSLDTHQKQLSDEQLLKIVYGRSRENITHEVMALFPDFPKGAPGLNTAINERYDELLKTESVVIEDSKKVFELCAKRWPVAIVSGSTRQHIAHFSEVLGVSSLMQFYIGAEDYSDGKPNPHCFLMAAEKFKVKPDSCLVFEDSNAGVRAAKAAGMYCVALQRAEAPLQDISLADAIVAHLSEFNVAQFDV